MLRTIVIVVPAPHPHGLLVSLLATLLVSALSCAASSSITILKSGQVARPLDRIYVVIHQGPLGDRSTDLLEDHLVEAFAGHAKAVRAFVMTGRELDDSAVFADIRWFRPDGILVLEPAGIMRIESWLRTRETKAVLYDATLRDSEDDHVIWRARPLHRGDSTMAGMGKRTRLMSATIVEHLVSDGVLRKAAAK